MPKPRRECAATWDAEQVFASHLTRQGYGDLTERRALSLLARRLLPPHIFDRLEVVRITAGRSATRDELGAVQVHPLAGTVRLELVLPAHIVTVTHEAAHILLDASGGGFAPMLEHDHGPTFRDTHLWCVRQALGLAYARRLGGLYEKNGL